LVKRPDDSPRIIIEQAEEKTELRANNLNLEKVVNKNYLNLKPSSSAAQDPPKSFREKLLEKKKNHVKDIDQDEFDLKLGKNQRSR
jgi:hypothetical protein